jgi:hypothetical protein
MSREDTNQLAHFAKELVDEKLVDALTNPEISIDSPANSLCSNGIAREDTADLHALVRSLTCKTELTCKIDAMYTEFNEVPELELSIGHEELDATLKECWAKAEFSDEVFKPITLDEDRYQAFVNEKPLQLKQAELFDQTVGVRDAFVRPYLADLYQRMSAEARITLARKELVEKTAAAEWAKDIPRVPKVETIPLAGEGVRTEELLGKLKNKFHQHFEDQVIVPYMNKHDEFERRPRPAPLPMEKPPDEEEDALGSDCDMSPGRRKEANLAKRRVAKAKAEPPRR